MNNYIDYTVIQKYMQELLSIPSPTGNTSKATKYITDILTELKVNYTITNKGAVIAVLEGEDKTIERSFSAHIDTLGAMVKSINENGTLSIVPIGGYMMSSIDGENCIIETMDEKNYTGTFQNIKPSVHIHGNDARELKKIPENMEVVLDEKVKNKSAVEALGISVGDFIFPDTRTTFTSSGFIKSRYLDDKASASILLYAIKYLKENNIKLPYNTSFFFSNYEEVGHGASSSHSKNIKEFISVDMGAPGKGQNSSEYSVCICAKDSSGPYDLELRKKLTALCREKNIDYRIDIYPYYGSDASAALAAGWDFKAALIGPGVFASHAYERTHQDAVVATAELIIAYSMEGM